MCRWQRRAARPRRHQGRITPSLLARSAEFREQFPSLLELRFIGRCNRKLVAEGIMGGGRRPAAAAMVASSVERRLLGAMVVMLGVYFLFAVCMLWLATKLISTISTISNHIQQYPCHPINDVHGETCTGPNVKPSETIPHCICKQPTTDRRRHHDQQKVYGQTS